jgi:hypothetical protein
MCARRVLVVDLAGRSSGCVVPPDGTPTCGSPLLGDAPGAFVLHNEQLVQIGTGWNAMVIPSKMADRGQITGGLVDGPLAFDTAISLEAARTKGIVSPVARTAGERFPLCSRGDQLVRVPHRAQTGTADCRRRSS